MIVDFDPQGHATEGGRDEGAVHEGGTSLYDGLLAVHLGLEVVDSSGAFTIPAELKDVVLQGGDALSVPVHFSPPTEGVLIATSALYTAGIQVWDREAGRIVTGVDLSGTGPGYQTTSCIVSPQPEVSHKIKSLPTIELSVEPEVAARGSTVHVKYTVSGATWVRLSSTPTAGDILPDGGTFDESTIGPLSSPASGAFDVTLWSTTLFRVDASNGDGFATPSKVYARRKIPVGYPDGSTPEKPGACTPGPVYISTLDLLHGYLEKIKGKLNDGCIRNNTNLNHFDNPDYLRGALTDDILAKMQNAIIYSRRDYLPTAYLSPPPGKLSPDASSKGVQGQGRER